MADQPEILVFPLEQIMNIPKPLTPSLPIRHQKEANLMVILIIRLF